MAALRRAAAQANKLPESIQGSTVNLKFNARLASTASRRGHVIRRVFMIGQGFLGYFFWQDEKPIWPCTVNIGLMWEGLKLPTQSAKNVPVGQVFFQKTGRGVQK
jgi:hypothetical protein